MKLLILIFAIVLNLQNTAWAQSCEPSPIQIGTYFYVSGGRIGTVTGATTRPGHWSVKFPGYPDGSVMIATIWQDRMNIEVACVGSIKKGTTVISSANDLGTVAHVFKDGHVLIRLANQAAQLWPDHVSNIGREVQCLENICRNQRYRKVNGFQVQVFHIFDNGKTLTKDLNDSWNSKLWPYHVSNLDVDLKCTPKRNCAIVELEK